MPRITPNGNTVGLVWSNYHEHLIVSCQDKVCTYDDTECDALLRVVDLAQDPTEDLAEFFTDEFGNLAWRVAVQFITYARDIAAFVYMTV